jgi:multidrug efflux pump subunit AcrA (membrane-fusion protein)
LLPILIVLAAVAAGCKGTAEPQASSPPEVSVIQVNPGPVTVYDEYVAQTQAPDTIEIRARVTGLLERQAFVDGARVKKGALLYVIDPRPFELELAQAKANLAQSEANLSNAKQNRERYERLVAQGNDQPPSLRQRGDAGARQCRHGGSTAGAGAQRRVESRLYEITYSARWLHELVAGAARRRSLLHGLRKNQQDGPDDSNVI